MEKLKLTGEGEIFKNHYPGHVAASAYYAVIEPITDEHLICVSILGQGLYSLDRRMLLQRSTDGGKTWKDEGLLWDPAEDDSPHTYQFAAPTRLKDGTIVLLVMRVDNPLPGVITHQPPLRRAVLEEYCLMYSSDDGHTWTPPEPINFPDAEQPIKGLDASSPIVELDNGQLMLPYNMWNEYSEDPQNLHIYGYCLFSSDRGKTWGDLVELPSNAEKDKYYSHGRFTRMRDGRVFVSQWAQAHGGQKDFDLNLQFADPTGKQWTSPQPTDLPGQSSWAADLGDKRMVNIYTCRSSDRPGIYAALSEDEGKTWDRDHELMLFDATGREYLGVEHPKKYPASHDNCAYGMPGVKVLSNGDILAHWWCTIACVTHTRYARLRVV